MNSIENKKTNSHGFKTAAKIVSIPAVGFARLFIAPFILPFLVGKKIYNLVKYAKGKPGHEINSFDIWYEKNECTEKLLSKQYKVFSFTAWLSLIIAIISLAMGIHSLLMNDVVYKNLASAGSLSALLFSFGMYFRYAVYAHCLKTRSFDYKLKAFTSIDGCLPNPFQDIVEAFIKTEGGGQMNVPVQFYPKGRNILKK